MQSHAGWISPRASRHVTCRAAALQQWEPKAVLSLLPSPGTTRAPLGSIHLTHVSREQPAIREARKMLAVSPRCSPASPGGFLQGSTVGPHREGWNQQHCSPRASACAPTCSRQDRNAPGPGTHHHPKAAQLCLASCLSLLQRLGARLRQARFSPQLLLQKAARSQACSGLLHPIQSLRPHQPAPSSGGHGDAPYSLAIIRC